MFGRIVRKFCGILLETSMAAWCACALATPLWSRLAAAGGCLARGKLSEEAYASVLEARAPRVFSLQGLFLLLSER